MIMQEFVADQSSGGQAEGGESTAQAQPQITSLDSLSEFEFQGERLTPDRLQEVFRGYKSASEHRAQSQAEERYWANLDTDIESVLANPQLADKFKSIYPEKFHRVLDRVLGRAQGQEQRATQAPQVPKEFLSKISHLESALNQMAVDSANAKLDAILPKLYDKYPLANEDGVLARAEAFIQQGGKMTDAVWERIAKESHEAVSKKADAFYKKQLQTQIDKGQQGKDAPSGGQIPGKSPAKISTFAEAEKAMIAHLKAQGMS